VPDSIARYALLGKAQFLLAAPMLLRFSTYIMAHFI